MATKKTRPHRANPQAILMDARAPLILTVTPADIKSASRESNEHCAAANALCRQEHFRKALVHKTKTYVQLRTGHWLRYVTPDGLYTEIMIFDRGGRMQPGEFKLMPPKGSQRLGQHAKPRGKLGRQGRVPNPQHVIDHVRADAPRGKLLTRTLME